MASNKLAQVWQLKNTGLSFTEIGRQLGISRQRAHQIYTGYVSPSMKGVKLSKHRKERRQELKNFQVECFLKEASKLHPEIAEKYSKE